MKLKEFVRKSTPSWGGTERHKISWTSARDQEIIRLVAALKPERAAWPPEKEEYYRSHVGELVNIEV